MTKEDLNKGNIINNEIEGALMNKTEIHKLYSRRNKLKALEIERIFAIAINAVGFKIERLEEDLKNVGSINN
jgi:hypothetical protein